MSTDGKAKRSTAQAANVTFELHTLGWGAFQNLCSHIAREILGQSVTVFSPGNDAGQDGAFQGTWQKAKEEIFSGRFVIQCKFTSRRDEHLGLGDHRSSCSLRLFYCQTGTATSRRIHFSKRYRLFNAEAQRRRVQNKFALRVSASRRLNLIQRLLEVGNQVARVFEAEGEADEVVHHADALAVLDRVIEE
jgi:hypothetical protein